MQDCWGIRDRLPEGKVEQVITSEGGAIRAHLEQVPAQPAGGHLVETKPINAKMGSKLAELHAAVKDLKFRMKVMEREIKQVPCDVPILLTRQMNAGQSWQKICLYYKGLGTLTPRQKAKIEIVASGKLQAQYEELNTRVDEAIKNHELDEAGDWIPKKKRQKKKTTKSVMKPSPDEEG